MLFYCFHITCPVRDRAVWCPAKAQDLYRLSQKHLTVFEMK